MVEYFGPVFSSHVNGGAAAVWTVYYIFNVAGEQLFEQELVFISLSAAPVRRLNLGSWGEMKLEGGDAHGEGARRDTGRRRKGALMTVRAYTRCA